MNKILSVVIGFIICTISFAQERQSIPAVDEKVSRILAQSRPLAERSVDTRATLKMHPFKTSSEVWWAYSLSDSADQIVMLRSLPESPPYSELASDVVAQHARDRVTVKPTGPNAFVAYKRFDDVLYQLGRGSEVRFDPEGWVDFYGENFRKRGIHVSTEGLAFSENTELLVNGEVWVFSGTSWTPIKARARSDNISLPREWHQAAIFRSC